MNFRHTRICGTRGTLGRDRHPADNPPQKPDADRCAGFQTPDMTAANWGI